MNDKELPKRKIVRPHDGLRLGYCETRDCKHKSYEYKDRLIVVEIRLTDGKVVCVCESCLDSLSGNIKKYKKQLKQDASCDIIEVGDKV